MYFNSKHIITALSLLLFLAYSSSKMEIKFGFESIHTQPQRFCLDSVEECPLIPHTNFTIQRVKKK